MAEEISYIELLDRVEYWKMRTKMLNEALCDIGRSDIVADILIKAYEETGYDPTADGSE